MIPAEFVVPGGAVGMLGLTVWMILMGWLVPRRTVREIERQRDEWRDVALKALGVSDKLVVGAEVAADGFKALAEVATDNAAAGDKR